MSRWRRLMSGDPSPPDDAWRRATQRLARAVERYHAQIAQIRDRRLRLELQSMGELLTGALEDVERLDLTPPGRGRRRSQGDGEGMPPAAYRAVGRAATLTAHATEAAMMAGDARWNQEQDGVLRCLDTVRTLVKAVRELADACLEAAG